MINLEKLTKTILNVDDYPKTITLNGRAYIEIDWIMEQLDKLKENQNGNSK